LTPPTRSASGKHGGREPVQRERSSSVGKRGNGEGSISKRKDGRYMARYTVQTPDGPKQKTITGKKSESRDDVAAKLTKAIADRDGGLVYDADNLKVGEYLERWLSDSVRDTVRQRTYEEYAGIVHRHLTPTLGRVKLKGLTPAQVRGLYRERLDSGLSNRTVQYIHVTLNKALKQAVADGMIPRNVAESVKAPRPSKKEIQPLSREQVNALLDTVRGERAEALYAVAITAGLREGELLALRWDDVDLDAGKLQVRRTASEARSGRVYEAPKCLARVEASASLRRLSTASESTASASWRSGCSAASRGEIMASSSRPTSGRRSPRAITTGRSRRTYGAPDFPRRSASTIFGIRAPHCYFRRAPTRR
jgi:integrase